MPNFDFVNLKLPGQFMTFIPHTIDLKQFRSLFPASDYVSMGDDFCVVDLKYGENLKILSHPCRFDGFLAFFCISGNLKIMINLTEFDVVENSLFINLPTNIVMVSGIDSEQKEQLHFIVMAMTREYMAGLKMDMHSLVEKGLALMGNPCFILGEEERALARKYLKLSADILHSNLMYKRESIASLLSSVFYLTGGLIEKNISARDSVEIRRPDRNREVFDRFLALVAEYHTVQRKMTFYADRMCLTPKYLSKLIKSVSGKSAPDWIDSFVILEAKNMLRYSDIPIKEIVSRLNFPNPSAFHKFFKLKTGLTPLQYRKA